MPKPRIYTVEFDPNIMTLTGVFDMLRYENARVRTSSTGKRPDFIRLELESSYPAFDRWRSFGIRPIEL